MTSQPSPRRRTRKIAITAIIVAVVAALSVGGWALHAHAQQRAAIATAQATFDADVAQCDAARAAAATSWAERRDDAAASLTEAIDAAVVDIDVPVADQSVLEDLASHLSDAEDMLSTEPIYTTITCTATPDPILTDAEPVVTEVINAVYPSISALEVQATRIGDAIEAIRASQLDHAREQLSDAIRAAQDVLDASDGEVDDDTIRTALQDAIMAAEAVLDEEATVDQLDDATESLTGPQAAVEDAHTAWLTAKAAADAASATSGTASSGGSSSGSGGSTSGGGSSSGGSSGTSGGTSSGGSSTPSSGGGGSNTSGSSNSSGGSTPAPSPTPAPTPTPTPAPTPAKVDEWGSTGGVSYSASTCSLAQTGWADSLTTARNLGASWAGSYSVWHLSGTEKDISIKVWNCLKP